MKTLQKKKKKTSFYFHKLPIKAGLIKFFFLYKDLLLHCPETDFFFPTPRIGIGLYRRDRQHIDLTEHSETSQHNPLQWTDFFYEHIKNFPNTHDLYSWIFFDNIYYKLNQENSDLLGKKDSTKRSEYTPTTAT